MRFNKSIIEGMLGILLCLTLTACGSSSGNIGQVQSYSVSTLEANWIKNGEPIEFESELWYPQDDIEVFTDPEMQPLGEYRGVQFFAAKTDVRPYQNIYTKFNRNQFRVFGKK